MGKTKTLGLIQPRPSPKMDAIFGAMLEGFPNARMNEQSDHYVLWGLIGNNYQMMQTFPKSFTFCDMPYNGRLVGDDYENSYWRWCNYGFHNNEKLDVPSDRFEEWGKEIKPYQGEGDFILICPSSETMTRTIAGVNQERWIQMMYDEVKRNTNKPIRVRYKPRKNGISGPSVEDRSMKEELEGCHALVTLASLTGVEALLEGVPVFSSSTYCPTSWCTNRDFRKINSPELYNRDELMFNLAYKQYSIKEYRDGTAYKTLCRYNHYQGS